CSSNSSTARQSSYSRTSSSLAVHVQSIWTSSVRRYHRIESYAVSTGGWYHQFSATSMGCQLPAQTCVLTLNEVRTMPIA
ncbi:unnamed protein product, partial [Rotaria magnacalcarata]